jgi:erythromycin esterase
MRARLEWIRQHNRSAASPVGFYGIDLPSSLVSLLPGLDAVLAYLAEADPQFQVDPSVRETAPPSRRPARSRAASQQRGASAPSTPTRTRWTPSTSSSTSLTSPRQASPGRTCPLVLDVQEAFARWTPP